MEGKSTTSSRGLGSRRILFVAGALEGGGAEGQLFQLANALQEIGHEVAVATLSPKLVQAKFEHHPICQVMTQSRMVNAALLGCAILRLTLLVRRRKPDVLISWLAVPTVMSSVAVIGTKTPWIAAVRNSQPEAMRSLSVGVMRLLLRKALARATMVIANSKAGLNGYRALGLLTHDRIAEIGNCIDTARFHPPSVEQRTKSRAHFGIPDETPLVTYVGRDAPEKDLELLVRTLAALPMRVTNLRIVVVGVSAKRLHELAAAAAITLPASMQVHARMQRIETVFMAADVLLLTSRQEGSPNVVHEARACGVAIVSTDCGDVRATMLPQDLVMPPDALSLVEAVAAVLEKGSQGRIAPCPMSPMECARRWVNAIDSILDH